MKVSMIIPTYKRESSLIRLLVSVQKQSQLPDEILIILPKESDFEPAILDQFRDKLNIQVLYSELGVCFQRNEGINKSKGAYIFLCDDDLKLEENYISTLYSYMVNNGDVHICSGQFLEKTPTSWSSSFPPKTWINLYFKKFFNHGMWVSMEDLKKIKGPSFILNPIISYYKTMNNTYSKAGWPLFTNQNEDVVRTKFYSLGASMIQQGFLSDHTFDEVLDPSGIGDNYGIALQMNESMAICVLSSTRAHHFKSAQNRLKNSVAYRRRVLAMDYFNKKYPGRILIKKRDLLWSVFGNLLFRLATFQFSMVYYSFSTFLYLLLDKNPYSDYDSRGLKSCRI